MSDETDFDIDGLLALEPSPDEDAWEAYVVFALEQMGAGDEAMAIDMGALRKLEQALGVQLPFEIGLLLVVGVPESDEWVRWGDDPAQEYREWKAHILDRILAAVEVEEFWSDAWGERPRDAETRKDRVTAAHASAAPLLPLYRDRVVPLSIAEGADAAESNPILALNGASVRTVASDLAAWLNGEFDVPLPMWPETAARSFPFWSDLERDDV